MKALLKHTTDRYHKYTAEDIIEINTIEELVELAKKEGEDIILLNGKYFDENDESNDFDGISVDDYDIELEIYKDFRE